MFRRFSTRGGDQKSAAKIVFLVSLASSNHIWFYISPVHRRWLFLFPSICFQVFVDSMHSFSPILFSYIFFVQEKSLTISIQLLSKHPKTKLNKIMHWNAKQKALATCKFLWLIRFIRPDVDRNCFAPLDIWTFFFAVILFIYGVLLFPIRLLCGNWKCSA